jgi:hypothetical protein
MRFSYRLKTERRVKSQIQVGYRHGGTVAVVDNLSHVRDAYLLVGGLFCGPSKAEQHTILVV